MAVVDYEKRMESKPYKFFDFLFRLIIVNVLSAVMFCTVLGIFPAMVAAISTMRDSDSRSNMLSLIKLYFKNLWHYLKKSLPIGLIMLILYAVIAYGIYFYVTATYDGDTNIEKFLTAGVVVMCVFALILTLLISNFPLIMINFEDFNIREIFRTGLYISLRYILTALLNLVFFILILGSPFIFFFLIGKPPLIAIWLLVGISLPLFLELRITYPIYYKLHKQNIEKIMHDYGDEDDEE